MELIVCQKCAERTDLPRLTVHRKSRSQLLTPGSDLVFYSSSVAHTRGSVWTRLNVSLALAAGFSLRLRFLPKLRRSTFTHRRSEAQAGVAFASASSASNPASLARRR